MDIDDFLKQERFKELDDYLTKEMYKRAGSDLVNKIIELLESEEIARQWFYSKNPVLNNERPYDYCLKGKQKEIEEEIGRAEYAIPS
jgi:uncharacterized protein (DUF2384 family)